MRTTLKSLLRACRIDLKKNLNKREKWVKDWAGQVCMNILAYNILWCLFLSDVDHIKSDTMDLRL